MGDMQPGSIGCKTLATIDDVLGGSTVAGPWRSAFVVQDDELSELNGV